MLIVDAHEDIAWNAMVLGRDVRRSALETRRSEENSNEAKAHGLAMVGLPEWIRGEIALVFGTLFCVTEDPEDPCAAGRATAARAHDIAATQLDYYCRLCDSSDRIALVKSKSDVETVLSQWALGAPMVGVVLLMEGADPILRPAEVAWWFDRGVRIVGPAWASGSCYAGGDAAPGPLTDRGRELLRVMGELGIVLDVSHLSDEAAVEAIDRFEGSVIASHANARALVPGQRQLSDDLIRRLGERGGVIGTVAYNRFLRPGWEPGDPKGQVVLADLAAAVDHVCQVLGDAAHVGLGSDLDGGFGAESAPAELDTVADLALVAPALQDLGYGDSDVTAVLSGNWLAVLRAALPD
jgi:membrane dipeptidase